MLKTVSLDVEPIQQNASLALKICNSISIMERQEVMQAYGLRDTRKSLHRKTDSKVTEAEEEELSYQFQSSLDGSSPTLVKLCGRELTIDYIGNEQVFTLGFWATYESIYGSNKVVVGFRLQISDYLSYDLYSSDVFVLHQWKMAFQKIIVMDGFYEDYKPTVKIGKGKTASVFLAKRRSDQESVAIKAFLKSQLQKDRKDMEGLENQVNILRSISHPNIIKILALYETEKSYYMILQYIEGKTLRDCIDEDPIMFSTCLSITGKLAAGLKYLAGKDIAHRDLKPENIILTKDNNPVIVDFGLATKCKDTEYIFRHCGTPGFVAPEILEPNCKQYTPKVDIYSLGIILYLLIFKKLPYSAYDYKSLLEQNKRANFDFTGPSYGWMPRQIISMLESMLDRDPNDRLSARKLYNRIQFKNTRRESSKPQRPELTSANSCSKKSLSLRKSVPTSRLNRF